MADDDEIDILGDFSLDNLLCKNASDIYGNAVLESHDSEILNCDCSSQWFVDQNSSSNSCWYSNDHSDICTDLGPEQTDYVTNSVDNQILTENYVTDESGWTKKEKNLLQRGIEIFGKSNARLSQFIGTKSTSEVKQYLKYYFTEKNIVQVSDEQSVVEETVVTSENITEILDINEVLDDFEIPASIEEVIAAVSTAKPTTPVNRKKSRRFSGSITKSGRNFSGVTSGQSVLKSSFKKLKPFSNIKQGGIHKQARSSTSVKRIKRRTSPHVKFKFRTKIKVSKEANLKKQQSLLDQPVNIHLVDTIDIQQNIRNVNGEEVVKISKEASDEESDLDVENDDNQNETSTDQFIRTSTDSYETGDKQEINDNLDSTEVTNMPKEIEIQNIEAINHEMMSINQNTLLNLNDHVSQQLMNMDVPTCEVILAKDVVTDLEKCIHSEFFGGRPTKTPSRYLKIRNHILNTWFLSRPSYVTKTSIRQGLKNCGDVNCIGRVHQFLEQIGAINFGCRQTNYVRPLYDMLLTSVSAPKEKVTKEINVVASKPIILSRPRIKKKFMHDGEGGCTLTHNENGDVINTTVVNEEPVIKQRTYPKNPSIRLIYCKAFTEDHPQEFKINLHLHTLLLMDLHAHTSHAEVMGLIGGYWNPQNKTLTISRYVPCRNIASSATHCDMCPISQAKAADIIHSEGLNILGWFHSHPTFAPEPSQQDLDTQLTVQQWIGNTKPCIGIILSPFSAHGALIASPYRCLIVGKRPNFEDHYVPFKFKVELISSNLDINYLLSEAYDIFNKDFNVATSNRVNFKKMYFLDHSITYFDKFISSVKMHLAKCSNVNKMECDNILQGFASICYNSA